MAETQKLLRGAARISTLSRMFIILGSDGVEYGPVDAATVKSWIKEGRAVLQTRARSADSAEWKTLADFPEFATGETPPPLPASAKVAPITIDAEAYAADLIARAKPLDITGCISRAWEFYKSDFGPILGVTLLFFLAMNVAGMVPFGSLIFNGVLMGGLYYYYLGKMRGQQRQAADLFVGLSRMTKELIIGMLAICGIVMACLLPGFIGMIIGVISSLGHGNNGLTTEMIAGWIVFMVCLLPVMYFSVVFTFVFPLIIDKNMRWQDALKVSRRVIHAQFWRFFGLMFLVTMITYLGLLAFIIGIIFLTPLSIAACAHAYEDLCNPPPREDGK